ncbi:MAG: 2-C-methyl-D-erythritol 4-phosphate cytidylyltransferase [Bacilli bacterium]|nr:2-C-methyl-D-erythritol 4-phosphate cytidylyltransferase [Bacilli bacterium]
MKSKTFVLFMMGGSGVRFGASKPKQFVEIRNTPIFIYPLKKYDEMEEIEGVVIVCNGAYVDDAKNYCKSFGLKKVLTVTKGGETRSESVYNGLKALKNYAADKDVILIHDATHPFVDKKATSELIGKIKEFGAGTLANYIFDTAYLKTDDGFLSSVIDRKKIAVGASPEGFTFKNIADIYFTTPKEKLEQMTSAGALALEFNIKMAIVEIDLLNLKITYQRDMQLYEQLLDYYLK